MSEAAPVVFITDDDPDIRDALRSLLKAVELHTEPNAAVAEFLADKRPDGRCSIVLDVRLAGVSGLEFQRRVSREGTAIPTWQAKRRSAMTRTPSIAGHQVRPFDRRLSSVVRLAASANGPQTGGVAGTIEASGRVGDPTEAEFSFGRFQLSPARRLLLEDGRPIRIGSRALDLLIALVERPGALVSKSELLTRVWPHAVVDDGNLKVHIAAIRRTLTDGQADDTYISTVAGRGYCFVAPVIQSSDPRAPAAASSAKPPTNVPKPLTRLIGVEDIIARVSVLTAQHRLITLVGPGGIGKTSVAMAAAAGLAGHYAHGAWFVDLSAVGDPRCVAEAVGAAIGHVETEGDGFAGLLSVLGDKRMLIVLDNCEHVADAAADLALQVMRSAPGVRILATSREPLGIEGEHLLRLRPLGVPAGASGVKAAEALTLPAIQLFVERAADVLGEFSLGEDDAPMVVEICRRLEGVPLAIEIAAASVEALGLSGIVARLDNPLRLPATRRRMAAPRHRTLRTMLDWSYALLTEAERKVLLRLSVFPGSFTMEEAAMVAADPGDTECEAVDRVVALVAKSLVLPAANGAGPSLRLLATTRAYAGERLAQSGEFKAR